MTTTTTTDPTTTLTTAVQGMQSQVDSTGAGLVDAVAGGRYLQPVRAARKYRGPVVPASVPLVPVRRGGGGVGPVADSHGAASADA
jgi:hypothetical protein